MDEIKRPKLKQWNHAQGGVVLEYYDEEAVDEYIEQQDAEIARLRERVEELEGLLRRGMDINHDDPNSETLAWYAETVKTLEEPADA